MRYSFPADYNERKCYVVAINASIIPLVAGALKHFEQRRAWHDDSEYEQAYNAFAELQRCFMQCCIDDLIESNNQLYRMIGTAIYGTDYNVISIEPELIVSPVIAPTHALIIEHEDSILGRMEDMRQLLQNALNGTITDLYTQEIGVRELLANLIEAINTQGLSDTEILEELVQIAGLLA